TCAYAFMLQNSTIGTLKLLHDSEINTKLADNAVETHKISNLSLLNADPTSGGNDQVLVTDAIGTVAWVNRSSFAAIADQTTITGIGTAASRQRVEDRTSERGRVRTKAVNNTRGARNERHNNKRANCYVAYK